MKQQFIKHDNKMYYIGPVKGCQHLYEVAALAFNETGWKRIVKGPYDFCDSFLKELTS